MIEWKCPKCEQFIIPLASKYITKTKIEHYCVVCGNVFYTKELEQ